MSFSKEIADKVLAMPIDEVESELRHYGLGTSDSCYCHPEAMRLKLFHILRVELTPTDPPGYEGKPTIFGRKRY